MSDSMERMFIKNGIPTTIIRSAGNVSTYVDISAKVKLNYSYELLASFPASSGVVAGDLILASGIYYLIPYVIKDEFKGRIFSIKTRLFTCNRTVSISAQDATTKKFGVTKTDVHCLVVDQNNVMVESDLGVAVPGMRGTKDISYFLYMQTIPELTKNSMFMDGTRKLRITGNLNPYYAAGITEVPVKIEE